MATRKPPRQSARRRRAEFVRLYLGPCRFNATEAALLAGYADRAKPERRRQSAAERAAKLLEKPDVQVLIAERLDQAIKASDVDLERTLLEYARRHRLREYHPQALRRTR